MPRPTKLNRLKKTSVTFGALPVEESKDEEIIGVNVLSVNEMPPTLSNKLNAKGQEEEKSAEGAQIALPDPKKKQTLKKASTHRDENAFTTYIFRVCKETCPDSTVSKKAMLTLNQIIADKFEDLMKESRELVITNKKGTITSKEIETCCKLLIPGELGQNAIAEGRKALTKYSTE